MELEVAHTAFSSSLQVLINSVYTCVCVCVCVWACVWVCVCVGVCVGVCVHLIISDVNVPECVVL